MTPTLDTDAIRKRFAEAIVINWCGNRTDILIPCEQGYMNLSTGSPWDDYMLRDVDWIIRPGDRCEGEDPTCKVTGVYRGITTCDWYRPFLIERDDEMTFPYPHIRPLPAPAAEPNPDLERAQKCVAICKDLAQWYQLGGMHADAYGARAAALFPETPDGNQ